MFKSWNKTCVARHMAANVVFSAFVLSLCCQIGGAQINVLTSHNDIARTGQNVDEAILTPSNVNSLQFGKLFSQPISGGVRAQPLYLSRIVIPGKGTHNVVYIATTNDYVYAFDADFNGGKSATPLWQAYLMTNTTPSGTFAEVGHGVNGTPVIDPSTHTLYLVSSEILSGGSYVTRLHALDVTTGAEKFGGPVQLHGSVPGTGTGSTQGVLAFDSDYHFQRPGLLFINGVLYIAFASIGDNGPWHGWIFSYRYNASTKTMQQLDLYCTSPNGSGGGIWMSGAGLAAEVFDPSRPYGRMFLATGNGTFTGTTPYTRSKSYGMSVMDLDLTGGIMTVEDTFTPFDEAIANSHDGDLGSGGPLLLPDEKMASGKKLSGLLQIGKTGTLYLLDRDNTADGSNNSAEYNPAGLGGYNADTDKIVQKVQTPESGTQEWGAGVWGAEAYWNNNIYVGGTNPGASNSLVAYSYIEGVLSTTPTSRTAEQFSYPGPTPSVSANGPHDAILWALKTDGIADNQPAVLLAYDATNLANLLYSSNTNLSRDSPGIPEKYIVPTIANGKVYVGGTGLLNVYGILADASVTPAPVISPSSRTFTGSQEVTISDSVTGATIYYTTSGVTPTANSAVYTGPITVTKSETIMAIASGSAALLSPVASATFTSTADTPNPVFSLAPGTYNGTQTLKLTDSDSNSAVYYTLDGTTPTTSSAVYAGPISIPVSETIQAIAVAPDLLASSVVSAAYAIEPVYTFNFSQGFANAQSSVQFNGSTDLDDFRLQLTNGGLNENSSAFYTTKVNVQAFTTDFTFQISNPVADGITFTIQNSSLKALGVPGAGLGFQNIPHSVAIKFDIYDNAGEGPNSTGIYLDGALPTVPAVNLTGTGIDLHSGDYMDVHITYDGTDLTMTITDAVTLASWSHSFPVDIPSVVNGTTAYVGFTGGSGGSSASQKLTYWTWTAGRPTTPNYPAGFDSTGLARNGAALSAANLQLSSGNKAQATSVYYSTPVATTSFSSTFEFQISKGSTSTIGNGFTFVLQNHSLTAVGADGPGLGYEVTPNSVAIAFNVTDNSTTLFVNGTPTSTPTALSNLKIANGDVFQVVVNYDGTNLVWNIRDMTEIITEHSQTTVVINIPHAIGSNTAYVGFTAGTSGTATAVQDILNWTYAVP